jgi:hypothetical protein
LSLDPDVDETDQPYAYTGGDPVVGTDPSGTNDSGTITINQSRTFAQAYPNNGSGGSCLFGSNPGGACFGADIWRDGVDIPQDASYLEYWGSYVGIEKINQFGSHFGPIGCGLAHIVSAPLVPFEASGLAGQGLGSILKGESVRLEDTPNQPLLGNETIGPISGKVISRQLGFPPMRFPGFNYYTHRTDFQW